MGEFPNFIDLDAAALESAPERTLMLALIGNLSFVWSNNESLFIHMIEALVLCDEATAVIIFVSLNNTRSRVEAIERLGRAKLQDATLRGELELLLNEFNMCTRIRNEFVHCMYGLNEQGALSHTQSFRIRDVGGKQALEPPKAINATRVAKLTDTVARMKRYNRNVFAILPRLRAHVAISVPGTPAPLNPAPAASNS